MSELLKKELFIKKPSERTGVIGFAYYTNNDLDLACYYSYMHKSDTSDLGFIKYSKDNGKTWSEAIEKSKGKVLKEGTHRDYYRTSVVDPVTANVISIYLEAILPTDNPLEGMKWWHVYYTVSKDGDRTHFKKERIIIEGDEFNKTHPIPDVYEGKNSVMLGDTTELPIILEDRTILLPVQITPIGPNGEYYNPGGGYTYHYSRVIRGTILDDGSIKWIGVSNMVQNEPEVSTRGAVEPTITQMKDKSILMVMRGSNDVKLDLPGYRWYSISTDSGKTFSDIKPWTYTSGEKFFSPSSCSQLLTHSNGKTYWLGNINNENPKGNLPRSPIFMVEVDEKTKLLKEETKLNFGDVEENQAPNTTYSNFYAREDRETNNIIVYITCFHEDPNNIFGSDSYMYTIKP